MTKEHKISKKVLEIAKEEMQFDGRIIYIGTYKGKEIYTFHFNEIVTIGFPRFYTWDGVEAKKEIGEDLPYFKLL